MSARLRASLNSAPLDSAPLQGLGHSTARYALLALATALTLLLVPTAAIAVVVEVDTLTEFTDALSNWQTGEEIEIQNGTYDDWGQVHVNVGGAVGSPLVIRGESKAGVIFTGDTNFFINANYVEFKTMTFSALEFQDIVDSHGGNPGGVGPGGSPIGKVVWIYDCGDVLLTDLIFEDLRAGGIWISGGKNVKPMSDITIEKSEFTLSGDPTCADPSCGKNWANIMISSHWGDVERITVSENTFSGYYSTAVAVYGIPSSWVAHADTVSILDNDFTDGTTESAIELGIHQDPVVMNAIVANNRVNGHSSVGFGGAEMVEIKSYGNRILNNSFIDVEGDVSNRAGTNNVFDGNYFLNSTLGAGALRIHDPDNQVTNNIFLGGRVGLQLRGVGGQEADRTLIANNTFIGQTTFSIWFTDIDPPNNRLPEDMIFINNVIVADEDDLISHTMHSSTTFTRNVFHVPGGAVSNQSDPMWGYEPFFVDPFPAPLPVDLSLLDEEDTFGATSIVVARGLSVNELTQLAVSNDYLGVARPLTRGTDIGHLEQGNDDCPDPGDATSTVTPTVPAVPNGESIQFVADSIADPDGLGYPLLWTPFFIPISLTQSWDFNAGSSGATVSNPLVAWSASPLVDFDLGPITQTTNHPMELSIFDQTGCETVKPVNVTVHVDPVPPTAPTGAWGGVVGVYTVVLWTAATSPYGEIDYYRIFRDGDEVGTTSNTLYIENPGGAGTYDYTVEAVGIFGAVGPESAPPVTLVMP